MGFSNKLLSLPAAAMMAAGFLFASATPAAASINITVENRGDLGIIRGIVRDEGGSPIADATVAIFRLGTSTLLKQVHSASNGSFLARILPGTYTVLAVAQGFNPVTLSDVEVNRAADLVYGFRLESAGSGNTAQMVSMLKKVMQTPEGAALLDRLSSQLQR